MKKFVLKGEISYLSSKASSWDCFVRLKSSYKGNRVLRRVEKGVIDSSMEKGKIVYFTD